VRQPYLKPWYRLGIERERVLLEYGHRLVVLRGAAAGRLLPALLPLLDGTRSESEIVARLGEAAAPAVRNVLGELDRHGLLTEGPPLGADAPPPHAEAASFLAATAPMPLAPAAVREALAGASVTVAGAGPSGAEIARLLRLDGVGEVRPAALPPPPDRAKLVVTAPAPGELERQRSWNEAALERGVAWLQVLPFDGRIAAVGPLYLPGETCCHECFRLRRASTSGYREDYAALERLPAHAPSAPSFDAVLAGLAAQFALRWLAHADPRLPGTWWALEHGPRPALTVHRVYRVPRCPVCGGVAGRAAPSPWPETGDAAA
jgi:bacteriocin biosynthesis cyclodehydratase domain-containing protein